VSWHQDEYAALGVPFGQRGAILDEQLEVLDRCWAPGPVSYHGRHYSFDEVWVEPHPFRPRGPALWFGGQRMHPALLRRIVRWGCGFNPLGPPSAADIIVLRDALRAAGRDPAEVEMVGGLRGRFAGPDAVADLEEALRDLPGQLAAGFGTICFKPSMYIDDAREAGAFCRRLAARVAQICP
jgi:alkanesulfonate monooxygenase SsuD/methylene tetrahydromethanopterin reductase-like flavin-dependent oxidoreductase (luciferase family)